MEVLKIGDKVFWSGNYGREPYVEVTIKYIEKPIHEEQKQGIPLDEVEWTDIRNCVVELHSGKWAYGYQIRPISERLEEVEFYEQD
jgi:hypothetical protein